jgi:hypothetical protein
MADKATEDRFVSECISIDADGLVEILGMFRELGPPAQVDEDFSAERL